VALSWSILFLYLEISGSLNGDESLVELVLVANTSSFFILDIRSFEDARDAPSLSLIGLATRGYL
jgi:hypothetical protein